MNINDQLFQFKYHGDYQYCSISLEPRMIHALFGYKLKLITTPIFLFQFY